MQTSFRLTAWGDSGNTSFNVTLNGEGVQIALGVGGLVLSIPYETQAFGALVDGQQLSAHLATLEGWMGHDSDPLPTIRIPSQIVMPNGYRLDIPLSHEQLALIDAKRTEDTHLKVILSGTARIPVAGQRDDAAANSHGVLVRAQYLGETKPVRTDSNSTSTLTILREHWLKLLTAAGPRRFRLIELPTPERLPRMSAVVDALERSTVQLRRSEWRNAIATAREVIEGVFTEVASHWAVPLPTDGSRTKWCEALGHRLANCWPGDADSARLLGSLLAASWAWTSEEHHYSPTIVSKRAEAAFAIGLATDLLLLANELIAAHPSVPTTRPGEAS